LLEPYGAHKYNVWAKLEFVVLNLAVRAVTTKF